MGVQRGDTEGAGTQPPSTRGIVLGPALGFFLVFLPTTTVTVALPAIRDTFDASVSGLQWVLNAYTLVFASVLLTAGALADRFGAKRVFLIGVATFTAASIASAATPTLAALVATQIPLGLGAAAMVPSSLSLVSRAFVDADERTRALATWAGAGATALAAGPVVGGVLVQYLGWRSVFLAALPACAAAYIVSARGPPGPPPTGGAGLDPIGQVLGVLALSALALGLIEAGGRGGSPLVVAAFAVALVSSAAFVAVEQRVRTPMLPLALFRTPAFSAAVVAGLLLNFGFYGQLFVLSLFFQDVLGYSALATGLAFLPMTATIVLANRFVGELIVRLGTRIPMSLGLGLCALGLLALVAVDERTPYLIVLLMLVIVGIGGGLAVPPMVAAVLQTVPDSRSGIASAVLNSSRQVGGVIGVAVFGALVSADRFMVGMDLSLIAAGVAMLAAAAAALRWIPGHGARSP